jgi:hypothetical protein
MDWNRIETKWHEIARRLQQGASRLDPSEGGGAQTGLRPEKGVPSDAPDGTSGNASGDTMARVAG